MIKLIILATILIASNVWASSGDDLENCVYKDGYPMESRICEMFRKEKAEDDASKQQQADWHSGANLETCHWNTGNAMEPSICEALQKEKSEKDARKKDEEEHAAQLKREYDAEQAANKKSHDEFEREQAREEAALKRKCGKDYQTTRIGMTIKRLKECNGAIFVTRTVNAGGEVETYRTMFDFVEVKNGKIISYTER